MPQRSARLAVGIGCRPDHDVNSISYIHMEFRGTVGVVDQPTSRAIVHLRTCNNSVMVADLRTGRESPKSGDIPFIGRCEARFKAPFSRDISGHGTPSLKDSNNSGKTVLKSC